MRGSLVPSNLRGNPKLPRTAETSPGSPQRSEIRPQAPVVTREPPLCSTLQLKGDLTS